MTRKRKAEREAAQRAVFFLENLTHTKGKWAGQKFNLLDWQRSILEDVFGALNKDGFRQYRTVYIEIPKKNGKALAINTRVPTPDGWVGLGDIKPGDTVFDERGKPTKVIAVGPVENNRPCYLLKFGDGTEITADAEHDWYVGHPYWAKGYRIRSTKKLIKTGYRIPVASPLDIGSCELLIPPYTLGAWLGDGRNNGASLSSVDDEIYKHIEAEGITVKCGKWEHRLGGDKGQLIRNNCVQARLRRLNLLNNKHIPRIYLRASTEQRLSLLQGLMDTDGYCSKAGQCEFTTINKNLAEGVLELIRSLGLKVSFVVAKARLNGKDCGDKYRIQFWAYQGQDVFRLIRKKGKQKPRPLKITRASRHFIHSISKSNSVPVKCIQVDSPSGLFLAGDSMIPTHNSEFCAGVLLDLSFADGEPGSEVYSAAADRHQASIIFNISKVMVQNSPELSKRCDVLSSTKTIYIPQSNSTYQALSSESYTKHGYNVHGLGFDEFHTQPNRDLYDVLTKGSGAARRQPLHFFITTAGNNINSICYDIHDYAKKVLAGDIIDPTFYPVIYGLEPEDDWEDEKNWYKANPSLGQILDIGEFRKAFQDAKRNLAEENIFKQLRLNIWVKQSTRWMRMNDWDACGESFDVEELKGLPCYAGLDLSSSIDLTALSLVFPRGDHYDILMRFWIPEDTAEEKERKDRVPYREWAYKKFIGLTPGNVVDYSYIREEFKRLREVYKIRELAYDRWGAAKLIQDLIEDGFVTEPKEAGEGHPLIVDFGQGYKSMSPPTKELMVLVLSNKIRHGGNPVLRWNVDNLVIEQDAAENIKPNKAKSTQRIDGAVAMVMAIDRAIKHSTEEGPSIYETRGVVSY